MEKRTITGVLACDQRGVIAYQNKLPWDCPEDRLFYKTLITNHQIIMGRKTFIHYDKNFLMQHDSIVFSKTLLKNTIDMPSVKIVSTINELFKILPNEQCFMIGGGELTRFFIENNLLTDFYLTEISGSHPGDTFFPRELLKDRHRVAIKSGKGYTIYYYPQLTGDLE
ncbi:MAG: dihydrofolate reductase [Legionellaceae bacterium]|nr:dihydrofolate reductase [Legionellaceae bacterium]